MLSKCLPGCFQGWRARRQQGVDPSVAGTCGSSVSCMGLPDNIAVEGLVRQRLKEGLLTLALLLAWPWPQVKNSSSKVPCLAHDDNPRLCAACHLLQAVQELPVCQGGPAVHLRHK